MFLNGDYELKIILRLELAENLLVFKQLPDKLKD